MQSDQCYVFHQIKIICRFIHMHTISTISDHNNREWEDEEVKEEMKIEKEIA